MSLLASLLSTSVVLGAATLDFPVPVAPPAQPSGVAAVDVSDTPTATLATDPAVARLVERALSRRSELSATRARAAAERERAPQARALPDPVVGLAIQNDGFRELQIGKMPTSWVAMMAAQSFPWFGTRELRADLTDIGARRVDADLRRTELTVRAEVERAVLDVIANRDELALLGRLELLWEQSEVVARARYESGEGAQSDLLRAQLERNRLRRQRILLVAESRRRAAVLARVSGDDAAAAGSTGASAPVPGAVAASDGIGAEVPALHLADLADPPIGETGAAIAAAEKDSPELAAAAIDHQRAEQQVALARKDAYPNITVSAAFMARGEAFPPMWQAGVNVGLPIWSIAKREHAVAEGRARGRAADAAGEAVRGVLDQRVRERQERLAAAIDTNRLYRSGLLVQSEATVASALAQYRVGRVPFASVLEALAGFVSDVDGFYQSVVETQRLQIAARELSLAEVGGAGAGAMGGGPSAGASGGGMSGGGMGSGAGAASDSGGETGGSGRAQMGGM